MSAATTAMDLRAAALAALAEPDPHAKLAQVAALAAAFAAPCDASTGTSTSRSSADHPHLLDTAAVLTPLPGIPGRPARPELIHPAKVPRRSPGTAAGRAALLHAIAHIEFNAINLALDALWRFPGMPESYYHDWLRVAREEAYHFTLLRDHLATLGHAYGDFPAHDNLWQMCERTQDDVVARMALVPRTLEARGLDATPQIQDKLRQAATPDALRAVAILDIILRDEIGHVAIGNRWYAWLCEREGLDPVAHYGVLVRQYDAPRLHPPFNEEARRAAGFTQEELARLGMPPGDS